MGVPYRDLPVGKIPPGYAGGVQILPDTAGVDFGPYMKELRALVQKQWDPLVPQSAMPPMMKRGRVVIEFAIMKDGSVQGHEVGDRVGRSSLGPRGLGAITSAIPLPALPAAYRPGYLRLRTGFYYNSDPADFAKPPTATPTPQPAKQDPKN